MSKKPLKFIFVCPTQNKMFESANFSILENRGVIVDEAGNKMLDAKVELNNPCPFCSQKHVYCASELSCPFGASGNQRNPIKENSCGGDR
jgi:hypothetical protein